MFAPAPPMPGQLTTESLFERQVARSADRVAVRWHEEGRWKSVTWRQYGLLVRSLARRLQDLGGVRGTRIALFAETSFHWALVDLAVQRFGGIVVAIHPAYSADELAHALQVSGATLMFVGGEKPSQTLAEVPAARAAELTIYSFEDGPYRSAGVRPFRDLLDAAADPDRPRPTDKPARVDVRASDLATIVFTSGTSGMPKAVCLTQKNLVATALASYKHLGLRIDRPQSLHWLPFAHLFGRIGIYLDMVAGCLATYSRGLRELPADLQVAQPHFLFAVPKALRRFEAAIVQKVEQMPAWKAKLFGAAVRLASCDAVVAGVPARRVRPLARALQAALQASIFRPVTDSFGSNLRLIIVGSAPVETRLCAFIEAFGIVVCEGYGMTETSGVAFVNPYGRRTSGTVGSAIDTVQFKVDADHELLLKGESICYGYLSSEDNRAAFTADGWFRTGDLAAVTPDQYVSVIGRKKDVLITDGGENITPERIEGRLASHGLIKDAAVFGDRRPHLVAVLSVDDAGSLRPPGARQDGAASAVLRDSLQKIVDEVNRGLAVYERIRKFVIAREGFTTENGELTVTLKKRRAVILEHYRDEIEALYAVGPVNQPSTSRLFRGQPRVAARFASN